MATAEPGSAAALPPASQPAPTRDPLGPSRTDGLPPELLAELVRCGQTRSLPKHSIVVSEGEPALSMYLVLEGTLRIYASDEDGREVQFNVIAAGEYFGESMLAGQTRSASVQTLTRCRLCMITRDDFQALLVARPDLAFHLIQTLIQRVRVLSRNVQGLVSMDVYERVARLFHERVQAVDGRRLVPGPLSQQQIGDLVGASRSMINRVLKELSEGGYITVEACGIVLLRQLPKRW